MVYGDFERFEVAYVEHPDAVCLASGGELHLCRRIELDILIEPGLR